MAELKSGDAAFFAFRKRDQRFVLTRATATYLVFATIVAVIYIAAIWTLFSPLLHWYVGVLRDAMQGDTPSGPPATALTAFAPVALAVGLLSLFILASYEAACLKWLVRGERSGGLIRLTFGADAWRVFAIYWSWVLLLIAFLVGVAMFYAALIALGGLGGAARVAAVLFGALAPLALLAMMIFGSVRLAPAAATTIARKRFSFFGAWSVTRGQFWELLGAFVIVIAIYFGASYVTSAVVQIPLTQAMAPVTSALISGASTDRIVGHIEALFASPLFIGVMTAQTIVSMVLAGIYYLASFGVNARAVIAAIEDGKLEKAP